MGKHRIIQSGDVIEHLEIIENLGYREYCGKIETYRSEKFDTLSIGYT